MAVVQAKRSRGSAYVFLLSVTLIVTVLGMGALLLLRTNTRTTNDANAWEAAGALAFSATEQAMSLLNAKAAASPAGWRSTYTSGQTAFTQSAGNGTFSWAIKDESDGNLANNYLQSFRLYGIGRVGEVTRVYSVKVTPGGGPLDVLRTALHSGDAIEFRPGSLARAVNGPISSNAAVKLAGTVEGAIEAAAVVGSAGGTRTVTAPAPAKAMPPTSLVDDLVARGTAIPYASLQTGDLKKTLLSPSNNPFGPANPDGIYVITVPSTKRIAVQNCRIVGTLIVLGAREVSVDGPNLFEPGLTGGPTLLISSPGVAVTLRGNPTWLTESAAQMNFNPPERPYRGDGNATQTDSFPPHFFGITHVMSGGTGSVELRENVYSNGTIIADCPVKADQQLTLIQDPKLQAKPPFGYAIGDVLDQVPGTWKWDTLP